MTTKLLPMAPADVALLVVYAFVVVYFIKRFAKHGRWPSLGIAMLPSGWIILALGNQLGVWWISAAKWCGVILGLLLMLSVNHADRTEKN